jgi:hypothetical protein
MKARPPRNAAGISPPLGDNNPPDVILNLTHEQATFMLENCLANRHLALNVIMSVSSEKISREEAIKSTEKFVKLNEQFGEIMVLLRRAGAREKEEE